MTESCESAVTSVKYSRKGLGNGIDAACVNIDSNLVVLVRTILIGVSHKHTEVTVGHDQIRRLCGAVAVQTIQHNL